MSVEWPKQLGLKINANKSKITRIKAWNQGQIKFGEVEMEKVDEFRYLGCYISKDERIETNKLKGRISCF